LFWVDPQAKNQCFPLITGHPNFQNPVLTFVVSSHRQSDSQGVPSPSWSRIDNPQSLKKNIASSQVVISLQLRFLPHFLAFPEKLWADSLGEATSFLP
jgi:hypothetical protein